ncbi:MAG: polysaccharide deacetylase family protein, partial [Actinomycetota bacterium]
MRRTPSLLVLVAASSLLAACSSNRATQPAAVTPPATTSTVLPTTTNAATTTSSSTTSTSTTTTAVWQQFPIGPVTPFPKPTTGAPVISNVKTTDPVVFLTLDDGIWRDPRIEQLLFDHGATATLFLNAGPINQEPGYFSYFMWMGGSINSHTLSHPNLKGMSLADQK